MYNHKSILKNKWILKNIDERKVLYISQKFNFSNFLSKLISLINIKTEEIEEFLNPNIFNNIPNPFQLKDMEKTVSRTIDAIQKKRE